MRLVPLFLPLEHSQTGRRFRKLALPSVGEESVNQLSDKCPFSGAGECSSHLEEASRLISEFLSFGITVILATSISFLGIEELSRTTLRYS